MLKLANTKKHKIIVDGDNSRTLLVFAFSIFGRLNNKAGHDFIRNFCLLKMVVEVIWLLNFVNIGFKGCHVLCRGDWRHFIISIWVYLEEILGLVVVQAK